MTGHNPTTDRRSKLGTKRHILTDKEGIPLSTVITSANTLMMLLLQLKPLTAWLSKDHLQNQQQNIETTTTTTTRIRIRIRRKIRI